MSTESDLKWAIAVKTKDLTDIALDWAVTCIADPDALQYGVADWREQRKCETKSGEFVHRYGQSWAQAGPLIESYEIDIYCIDTVTRTWVAEITGTKAKAKGPSPLIAAMRCLVNADFGDVIDVPEELLK